MPRVVNNITRTEAIQSDLGIGKPDRNEPGPEPRCRYPMPDRPFRNRDFLFLKRACSPSPTLNDEDRFVINLMLFSNLPSMVVIFSGVLQQRVADVFC